MARLDTASRVSVRTLGGMAVGACSSPVVGSPLQHATIAPVKSFGVLREEIPAPIPCDPHRFRVLFPTLWQAFLRAHFRDAMHAAYCLGVTERTGRDWFEGKTGANGAAALYAVGTIPGAMDWIIKQVRKSA